MKDLKDSLTGQTLNTLQTLQSRSFICCIIQAASWILSTSLSPLSSPGSSGLALSSVTSSCWSSLMTRTLCSCWFGPGASSTSTASARTRTRTQRSQSRAQPSSLCDTLYLNSYEITSWFTLSHTATWAARPASGWNLDLASQLMTRQHVKVCGLKDTTCSAIRGSFLWGDRVLLWMFLWDKEVWVVCAVI